MITYKTSIALTPKTRDILRNLGRKDQAYESIILELIQIGAAQLQNTRKKENDTILLNISK